MTQPLRFIIEGEDQSGRAFGKVQGNLGKTEKTTEGLLAKFRDITVVAAGVSRAFKTLTGAATGTIDAAKEQVESEVKLGIALAKVTKDARNQLEVLKGYASAKQQVTQFGDEMILNLATIGTEFGVQGQLLTDIIDATIDRSIALRREPIEVMKVFAKFAGGVTDSLQDVGFKMQEGETRAQLLERAVRQSAVGLAESIGALPTSRLTQLSNAFGDLREIFGKVIVSTGTFQTIAKGLIDTVSQINSVIDNPAVLQSIAEAIDNVVRGLLVNTGKVIGFVIDMGGKAVEVAEMIVTAFKDMSAGIQISMLRVQETLNRFIEKTIIGLNNVFELSDGMKTLALSAAAAQSQISAQIADLKRLNTETDLGSKAMHSAAEGTRNWFEMLASLIGPANAVTNQVGELVDALVQMRQETNEGGASSGVEGFFQKVATGITNMGPQLKGMMGTVVDGTASGLNAIGERMGAAYENVREILEEKNAEIREQMKLEAEFLGGEYANAFTFAIQGSFDRDVGVREAFRRLGDDARNIFIGQMSEAALSPIKQAFGNLTQAIARQFNFVGRIISAVLSPVINIVASVVTAVIGFLLEMIGVQALASALGIKMAAATTGVATSAAAAWGAAAVAASIATLGAALAFGPVAITQITLGSTIASGLAVGAQAGALGEGGLVEPRPGGVGAILAEKGEPELVTPLSKVGEVFGGSGVSVAVSMEGANVNLTSGNEEASAEAFGERLGQMLLEERDFERLRGVI